MPTCKDVLNELKWRHDALDEVTIVYRHRGAPRDERAVDGSTVVDLGNSFFAVEGPDGPTEVPYHRILRIERGGEAVWTRREDHPGA